MNRFERAMDILAIHEGGYVDHPKDPGGATMKGVTFRTYNAYRIRKGLPKRHVREITDQEVFEIYKAQYWDAVRAEELPLGVAYCVFDAAVNSGPSRAARWLQGVIGAGVDGVVGNETIGLAHQMPAAELIDIYCDKRLAFMKRLKHWGSFKNGWSRRVAEVRAQSKKWAAGYEPGRSVTPQPAKATGPEKVSTSLIDAVKSPGAVSGGAAVVGAVGTVASGDGPIQYALAAVLVIAALAAFWWLVRKA